MVLHGILEYLLQCSSTSRRVYDSSIGKCQDAIFANAVLEEFGDVGGKWR